MTVRDSSGSQEQSNPVTSSDNSPEQRPLSTNSPTNRHDIRHKQPFRWLVNDGDQMRSPTSGIRVALSAWVEARIYVFAAYIIATAVVERLEPSPAFTPLSDGLLAWDGRWYESIADHGYADAEDPAVRFFPLWALLGRAGGWLPGLDPGLVLVIGANLAAVTAGVLLYRLVIYETGDSALARRAVRLLALAPPSFVLVFAYSEAFYITLALAVFLLMRRQRWWTAAALGYLAGLTRPVGVLLVLPIAHAAIKAQAHRRVGAVLVGALTATMAPLAGAATFVLWAGLALDDLTAPLDRQRELRGEVTEPVSRLVRGIWRGLHGDEGELFHAVAVILLVVLTVVTIRRLGRHLALYTVPSVIILAAADNLNSLERYALAAFPLVIAAAILSRHRWFDPWITRMSAAALVCLATLTFVGVYVP